ncbi:MAG: hypothetical protein QXG03_11130 [Halalkalicoccus sp.]
MVDIPSPFGGREVDFDGIEAFVPEHLSEPGDFLDGHRVLADEDHVAFHAFTRELFEERGVYDVTFGYNLARLNLDPRHDEAGFRYAGERDDPTVLRAEFTPTSRWETFAWKVSPSRIRAWNALGERHDYDLVRVRTAAIHDRSDAANERLETLEAVFLETGSVTPAPDGDSGVDPLDEGRDGDRLHSDGSRAPF